MLRKAKRLPLNIQLFAEEVAQEPEPAEVEVKGNEDGAQSEVTFEQLLGSNKEYQSEFDRRVQKALDTAKSNWEAKQAEEKDEAKKLSKMTEEQRELYALKKEKEAFATQKAQFAKEQMQVAVGKELMERGLDASFAEYLTADNAETSRERIDAFEKLFQTAVSAQLNNKMRGNPPKDPGDKPANNDPFLMGFDTK